jgi:hypothetical protein
MRIRVETYAGHGGIDMPRRFRLDSREIDVVDNLDQWPGLDHQYFKVKGDDGCLYILRFDANQTEWELTMFQAPQAQASMVRASRPGPH